MKNLIHQIHKLFLGFVTQHMLTGNEIGVSMIYLFCFITQQVVTKNAGMCTMLSIFINDDTVQYVTIY